MTPVAGGEPSMMGGRKWEAKPLYPLSLTLEREFVYSVTVY